MNITIFMFLLFVIISILAGRFFSFLEKCSRFMQGPILVGKTELNCYIIFFSLWVFSSEQSSFLLGYLVIVLSGDIQLLGSFLTFLVALMSSSELELP